MLRLASLVRGRVKVSGPGYTTHGVFTSGGQQVTPVGPDDIHCSHLTTMPAVYCSCAPVLAHFEAGVGQAQIDICAWRP